MSHMMSLLDEGPVGPQALAVIHTETAPIRTMEFASRAWDREPGYPEVDTFLLWVSAYGLTESDVWVRPVSVSGSLPSVAVEIDGWIVIRGGFSAYASVTVDGSSSPDRCGAGAVIEFEPFQRAPLRVVWSTALKLPTCTNNVAEYRAVIEALRVLREWRIEHVLLRSDSQLVVRQLQGLYEVRAKHLVPLHLEATELLHRFRAVQLEWIPREQNHAHPVAASG